MARAMEIGLNLFIAMKDMMSGDDMTGRVPNGMTGEHGQTSRRARGACGDRFTDLIGQSPKIPRKSASDRSCKAARTARLKMWAHRRRR